MIFLDHAATTPVDRCVREFLLERLDAPRNPLSVHRHGQKARAELEQAREQAASILGVRAPEVVFLSSATEANNLAIRGLAGARPRPLRVVSSPLEHACVRETLDVLAKGGAAEVSLLPVEEEGTVWLGENGEAPADLLCVMAVQNETGVVQPLEAARAFKERTGALWLCDITQAVGGLPIDAEEIGADFYSLSSHKIYGPPGVGALAGPGVKGLVSQITGGPQENEHRAGTQAVALIEAFVFALGLAQEAREERRMYLAGLEGRFLGVLSQAGIVFHHNGAGARRVPGFLNLSFPGFLGADLVIALDARGFSVSSGSACATGVMEVSPTLEAMFPGDGERARAGVRITPGKDTRPEDMEAAAKALVDVVSGARRD